MKRLKRLSQNIGQFIFGGKKDKSEDKKGSSSDVNKIYNSGSSGTASKSGSINNQKEIVVNGNNVIKNYGGTEIMNNNQTENNNINGVSENTTTLEGNAVNNNENSDTSVNANGAAKTNALPGLTPEQTVEVLKELHYLETVDSSMAKGLNNPKGWQIILDAKMWNLTGGATARQNNSNSSNAKQGVAPRSQNNNTQEETADPIVKGGSSGVMSDQLQRLRNGNLSSKEAGDILLKLSQS